MSPKSKRGVATGIYSATVVLLVALVLMAANFLTSRILARADLTKDREFTVSKATREVLRDLDDIVTVNVYFSKKLPPNLATLRRNIDDVLREYQAYSHGKVRVEYVDPSEDPKEEQKLRFLGIPQVQLNVLEKDQLQVINGYMGIAILYADRHEAIPIVQDVSTLEYDLTAGILQVLSKEKRIVGYLTGVGEPKLQEDFEPLAQMLSKTYEVRPVDLRGGEQPVPPEVNTLIVARPQSAPERVQWQIDQFVMRGGKVLFLVDPVRLDEQMGLQNPIPVQSGLDDMLAHYGVKVEHALVQDRLNEMAGFSQGYLRYSTPYPLWPKVSGKNLSESSPITGRLESLVLPWTAPLDVNVAQEEKSGKVGPAPEGTPQPDVHATILAKSSPQAWLQTGGFDLTPPNPLQPVRPPEQGQTYPLAVSLVGSFRSYFAGKPAPGDTSAAGFGAAPAPAAADRKDGSPVTQMIVIGNSMFASANFLSMFPGNQEFILNAIDWMTLGDKLIAIRSRGASERPLGLESATTKALFKYGNTFGMALLVAIFGVVRFSLKRRARSARGTHAAPLPPPVEQQKVAGERS
ncbi:MAG: GldG family protein [Candidatus Eisenbacteria bacterium]|nr:GldG family protein [Candidatus Eisenbacteria bacterium]